MDTSFSNSDTAFYIDLNVKKGDDYFGYGRFYIGDDANMAYELFSNLAGKPDIDREGVLRLDFMEMRKGIPVNIKMLNCTLEQVSKNCRMITKETFKRFSLGI
ncbi:MAG TPA: hypothetical protein VN721_09100 [Flavipsychrobacter sp.]|nr:hypothetical protein [Flavipsychrobacter sp.]